jgi:cell division septation protein DedD
MRALVTATVRLLRASAGEGQQPSPPLSVPELRRRVDGWSGPREPQDETPDDLPAEDEEPKEVARWGPSHGIWIAVTTFVPTFLATFFGIAYLAGPPTGTRFPAGREGEPQPVMSALAPQRDFVAIPRQQAQAPAREALGNAAVPPTTPASRRPALQPTHPQVEPKAAKPKRSAATVTRDAAWVRGAAFSDRDSAERLAASIERQGYPVKVRRDDTPNTPWVVWIGKHPRGMTPSERGK